MYKTFKESQLSKSLHPNLARIASEYDNIFLLWSTGKIEAKEAQYRISRLSAPDDNGELWHIDPQTAEWYVLDQSGRKQKRTPPNYGFASVSPYLISRGTHSEYVPPELAGYQDLSDPLNRVRFENRSPSWIPTPNDITSSKSQPTTTQDSSNIAVKALLGLGGIVGLLLLYHFHVI
jgi:hypothetical protein